LEAGNSALPSPPMLLLELLATDVGSSVPSAGSTADRDVLDCSAGGPPGVRNAGATVVEEREWRPNGGSKPPPFRLTNGLDPKRLSSCSSIGSVPGFLRILRPGKPNHGSNRSEETVGLTDSETSSVLPFCTPC